MNEVTKTPPDVRRERRIMLFCNEIRKILVNHCMNTNRSYATVDRYIHDITVTMISNDAMEYSLGELLGMMYDTNFLKNVIEHHKSY